MSYTSPPAETSAHFIKYDALAAGSAAGNAVWAEFSHVFASSLSNEGAGDRMRAVAEGAEKRTAERQVAVRLLRDRTFEALRAGELFECAAGNATRKIRRVVHRARVIAFELIFFFVAERRRSDLRARGCRSRRRCRCCGFDDDGGRRRFGALRVAQAKRHERGPENDEQNDEPAASEHPPQRRRAARRTAGKIRERCSTRQTDRRRAAPRVDARATTRTNLRSVSGRGLHR